MDSTTKKVSQTTTKSLVVRNASMKAPWKANQRIYPDIIPFIQLGKVHPWIKNLFRSSVVQNLPLAGGLRHFV